MRGEIVESGYLPYDGGIQHEFSAVKWDALLIPPDGSDSSDFKKTI